MKVQNGATGEVLSLVAMPKGVKLYLLMRFFLGSRGLFLAAVPVIWNEHNISNPQIGIIEVTYSVCMMLLLFVGGAVADLKGRRVALMGGVLFVAIASLGYLIAGNFRDILLTEALFALGWALYQPSEAAMLRDTLNQSGLGAQFERVRSWGVAIALGATTITLIIGGLLAKDHSQALIAVDVMTMLATFVVVACMREPQRKTIPKTLNLKTRVKTLAKMVKGQLISDTVLRSHVGYYGLISTGTMSGFLFLNNYCLDVKLSTFHFGLILATSNLISSVSAKLMPTIERYVPHRQLFAAAVTCTVLPLLLAGSTGKAFAAMAFVLHGVARAYSEVILMTKINARLQDEDSASVNALTQVVFRLIFIVLSVMITLLPPNVPAALPFLLLGLALGLAFMLLTMQANARVKQKAMAS